MANGTYNAGEQKLWTDGNWVADDIRVILVDLVDYTVDLVAHAVLSDVPFLARVAIASLSGKTAVGRVINADDTTFTNVSGDIAAALVFYINTGNEATSTLLFYFDTGIVGIPVTPVGDDITVRYNVSGLVTR